MLDVPPMTSKLKNFYTSELFNFFLLELHVIFFIVLYSEQFYLPDKYFKIISIFFSHTTLPAVFCILPDVQYTKIIGMQFILTVWCQMFLPRYSCFLLSSAGCSPRDDP
jgi:amino acid permease